MTPAPADPTPHLEPSPSRRCLLQAALSTGALAAAGVPAAVAASVATGAHLISTTS